VVGIHNKRIYTEGDNPWCKTCINGEKIVGEDLLKSGAYICYCDGIPTKEKCDNYQKDKRRG
jgi:hypothetical protein